MPASTAATPTRYRCSGCRGHREPRATPGLQGLGAAHGCPRPWEHPAALTHKEDRVWFSHGLAFTNQQSASMTNNCLQLSLAENKANLHMLNLN